MIEGLGEDMATAQQRINRLVLVTQLDEAIRWIVNHKPAEMPPLEEVERTQGLVKRMEKSVDRLRRGWPVSKT